MANEIKDKKLWNSLDKVKKQDKWLKAAENLKLKIGTGKGSHYTIRVEILKLKMMT